jgi:hypothetical protein
METGMPSVTPHCRPDAVNQRLHVMLVYFVGLRKPDSQGNRENLGPGWGYHRAHIALPWGQCSLTPHGPQGPTYTPPPPGPSCTLGAPQSSPGLLSMAQATCVSQVQGTSLPMSVAT